MPILQLTRSPNSRSATEGVIEMSGTLSATEMDAVVGHYIAIWNETDPARRRGLIAETWSEDATYVDPMQSGQGRDGIDAMVAAVQEKFPGFRFALSGRPDGFREHARFGWSLFAPGGEAAGPPVAAGIDFATLDAGGRLRTVVGFLEQLPAPQPVA
jgi:hypothetical protein